MKFEAIIVLGCRVLKSGGLPGPASRRCQRAAQAFHAHEPEWVVVSGGRRYDRVCEAQALACNLVAHGIPEARLICEYWSLSTAENAYFAARILRAKRLRHIALVTCDWHMPRAQVCFARAGFPAHALPAPTPPSSIFREVGRALHEAASTRLDLIATWGVRGISWDKGLR